jgi:hypothetical protein
VTVNSKEENSEDFCPNYVQEFSLWCHWLYLDLLYTKWQWWKQHAWWSRPVYGAQHYSKTHCQQTVFRFFEPFSACFASKFVKISFKYMILEINMGGDKLRILCVFQNRWKIVKQLRKRRAQNQARRWMQSPLSSSSFIKHHAVGDHQQSWAKKHFQSFFL